MSVLPVALCCALLSADAERLLSELPAPADAGAEADARFMLVIKIRSIKRRTPAGYDFDLSGLTTSDMLLLNAVFTAHRPDFFDTYYALSTAVVSYIGRR